MLDTIRISAEQVAMLFVLIGLGVILRRLHIFEGKGISCVTDILFYIISPCIIIDRLVRTASENGANAFKVLGWSALAACIGFAVLLALVTLFFIGKHSKDINAVKYASIFANMGFMGIPLVEGILGPDAAAYVSVSVAVFTVLNFILGISLFTDDRKNLSSVILNPGTIAIIIALGLIVLPCDVYNNEVFGIVMKPINWLASAQTPMSMMLCGAILGGSTLKGLFKDKYIWISTGLRLVVLPAFTTAALLALPLIMPIPQDIVVAMSIAFACPSAVAGAMFAEKFGGNTDLLTKATAITTLLSIITIPLVCAACNMVYPM